MWAPYWAHNIQVSRIKGLGQIKGLSEKGEIHWRITVVGWSQGVEYFLNVDCLVIFK